ncbi:phage tail tape measure protein [Streptomyces sp. NPDC001941]|uniref:phage tail tape measure protein n=1 Tax=Streptomyces sp. NPDC001941 TaxID=3154659 RepID=UPI0033257067
MSDTSLVFNLVARDRASAEVGQMAEKFNTAAATIGAGFAGALGVGIMANIDAEAAGDKLAAQLGVGPAEAAELSRVSASVYRNAWGESTEEVNEAIRGVYQNIGDTSAAEGGLEGVTTKVMALASTFDQEIGKVSAAAGQLVRTGLADSADEAFDIMTAGFQSSANKADDLLDTLNEYSTQWRRIGLDGQTAIGLISQGMAAGARDSDQVADALGQFGERALAGGTAVDAAFQSIGLSSADMAAKIGAGGATSKQALQLTMDALRGTANEQVRLNAAAALFGDPGNVLGAALFALNPATASAAAGMDKAAGATDKLVDTVGGNASATFESFKRKVLGDLGDAGGVVVKFAMDNQSVMLPLLYTFAGLAATVAVTRGVMVAYSAVSSIVTGAHALISASCWTVIGNWMRMTAIGLAAYVRIGAAAVVAGTTTAAAWIGSALVSMGTWLAALARTALTASMTFIGMAARAVAWAVVMAAQWLIAMGPVGWVIAAVVGLAALIIANWAKIKAWTGQAFDWVWNKIKSIGLTILSWITGWPIVSYFLRHWDRIKTGVAVKVLQLMMYVSSLPGRISRALGNLGSLLYGKGADIVRGLWNGIVSMGGWLRDSLMGWARNLIPGPIAKALGIASPSRVMALEVGRWIPAGVVQGIEAGQPAVARTMASLVEPPPAAAGMAAGGRLAGGAAPMVRPGAGGGGVVVVRLDVTGADGDLLRLMRRMVRVEGYGNAQLAFGDRR